MGPRRPTPQHPLPLLLRIIHPPARPGDPQTPSTLQRRQHPHPGTQTRPCRRRPHRAQNPPATPRADDETHHPRASSAGASACGPAVPGQSPAGANRLQTAHAAGKDCKKATAPKTSEAGYAHEIRKPRPPSLFIRLLLTHSPSNAMPSHPRSAEAPTGPSLLPSSRRAQTRSAAAA